MVEAPKLKYPYTSVKWAFMKWCDIASGNDPERVYLRRLRIFQTPWFALYLHQIWEGDLQNGQTPAPHNHPAPFWIRILKGGYKEVVYPEPIAFPRVGEVNMRYQGTSRRMGTSEAHYIQELFRVPTWTLVWVGRRNPAGWGFFTPDGYIPWEDFDRASA